MPSRSGAPENQRSHDKQNLAMVFAAMNLSAFAFHTVYDCLEDLWARALAGTLTSYLIFPDWETLMTTLIKSKPPPEIEKQIWA